MRKLNEIKLDEAIETIKKLYTIIDNVSTIGDISKSNNELYRNLVENEIENINKTIIYNDGYTLLLKD